MKPKRTIIVRGSVDSCQALYNTCLSIGIKFIRSSIVLKFILTFNHLGKNPDGLPSDNKVFIARKNETIDATIESHIYQVRLKDSLLSSLIFGKARDGGEVAWIDSRLTYQVTFKFLFL